MANVGAILLAAGTSTRMGRNKLLMPLGDRRVVLHSVDAIAAAGLGAPIIVMGHEQDALAAALQGHPHRPVVAHDYVLGMAHSLRAAIAAVPAEWDAAFICLGDMPGVPAVLLQEMAKMADPSIILIPRHNGKRGNPVLWGRQYFSALGKLGGDVGGRQLFTRYAAQLRFFDTESPSILQDIDRPEDVAACQATIRNSG